MDTPTVNPVGLLEYPDDFEGQPRTYSRATRLITFFFLGFFAAITIASTVLSLGAYCLTSDGGDTRALRSSPLIESTSGSELAGSEARSAEDSVTPNPVP